MSVFVERAPTTAGLEFLAKEMLGADPQAAQDDQRVSKAAAAIQSATATTPVNVNWLAVGIGFLAAALLIGVGVYLIWLGDQLAIDQAKQAASNPAYKVPTLGIAAAGTSLITLGGAWSAALVTVLLTSK